MRDFSKMTKRELLEKLIETHKKVDVNALSDEGWRAFQSERRQMELALRNLTKSV